MFFALGVIALIINAVINLMEVGDTFWISFLKGETFGVALGVMILGILYTTGRMEKLRAFKLRLLGRSAE